MKRLKYIYREYYLSSSQIGLVTIRVYKTYYSSLLGKIIDILVYSSILTTLYTYTKQILYISIYDSLYTQSEDDIQYISKNRLINIYSRCAIQKKQLDIEIKS